MPHSFPTRRCADLAVGDLPRRERRALPAPPLSARSEVIEVELAAWPPSSGIGNPAVDVGFMPPCAVGADFELGRERAFGDLDRKSTRLNSSHSCASRMPSSS